MTAVSRSRAGHDHRGAGGLVDVTSTTDPQHDGASMVTYCQSEVPAGVGGCGSDPVSHMPAADAVGGHRGVCNRAFGCSTTDDAGRRVAYKIRATFTAPAGRDNGKANDPSGQQSQTRRHRNPPIVAFRSMRSPWPTALTSVNSAVGNSLSCAARMKRRPERGAFARSPFDGVGLLRLVVLLKLVSFIRMRCLRQGAHAVYASHDSSPTH